MRPKCPKCQGTLIPYRHPISEKLVSVSCVNCGHIIDRDNRRRPPTTVERKINRGIPYQTTGPAGERGAA